VRHLGTNSAPCERIDARAAHPHELLIVQQFPERGKPQ
jgi:hypothetical protein